MTKESWLNFGDFDLAADDRKKPKFLGAHTESDLVKYLEEFGVSRLIRDRGFTALRVQITPETDFVHRACLYGKKHEEEHLLMDLSIRHVRSVSELRSDLRESMAGVNLHPTLRLQSSSQLHLDHLDHPGLPFVQGQDLLLGYLNDLSRSSMRLDLVVLEWMRLQDPTRKCEAGRRLLPGQTHPGLGCGKAISRMIGEVAARRKRDALSNSPAYFHNAMMYSKVGFLFGNPQIEAAFRVLLADLEADIREKGLAAVSFAFLYGRVKVFSFLSFFSLLSSLFSLLSSLSIFTASS